MLPSSRWEVKNAGDQNHIPTKMNDAREKVLHNQCDVLCREIKTICQRYGDRLSSVPAVQHQLRKTENRAMEYVNGTFIVLVVGPVKSGKSTLVNLIAGAYVSPTHFLECTVKPSIISQKRAGEDCKITVFTSRQEGSKVEKVDAIIDCIRGIEKEDALAGIDKEEYALTKANIQSKVKLGLRESLSSETLLTSITTPGGKLLQDDVFIIDMPGFDGEFANIEDPFYDTITQRADLIIFVQSSNSAISKVSAQFLKKLSQNNQDVPVCLIHNIFDSAHWRSEAERNAAVKEQRDFACEEIRKMKFTIHDDQCFSINLGMVEDAHAHPDNETLQTEAARFLEMETLLYDRVIHHRDMMRLEVCLGRTHQQMGILETSIRNQLDIRQSFDARYKAAQQEFNKLREESKLIYREGMVAVNMEMLKQVVASECDSKVGQIHSEKLCLSDSGTHAEVGGLVTQCEKRVDAILKTMFSLDQKERELLLLLKERTNEIQDAVRACQMNIAPLSVDQHSHITIPPVDLESGIDFDLIIPHKPRYGAFGHYFRGHKSADIISYMNTIRKRLTGSYEGNDPGYLESTAIPPILEEVENQLKDITEHYALLSRDYLNHCERHVLDAIIPDKAAFDETTRDLEEILQSVKTMLQETAGPLTRN